MSWVNVGVAAAGLVSSAVGAKGAKDASKKAAKGSKAAIEYSRESRDRPPIVTGKHPH